MFFQLRLDEEQLKEQENLRSKLQKEQDLLSAYQAKQAEQLMHQHEREWKELQDTVSVRRAVLEQKVRRMSNLFLCGCILMLLIAPLCCTSWKNSLELIKLCSKNEVNQQL